MVDTHSAVVAALDASAKLEETHFDGVRASIAALNTKLAAKLAHLPAAPSPGLVTL
jgi:hypothetical protein